MNNPLKTMLRVDFGRMLRSRLFYILIAVAFVIPVVMIVMMTMMDGTVSTDPNTGAQTVIHGPESCWQSIGTLPSSDGMQMGGMDVMAMCNINMMFMLVCVFVCLFISDDFRSGYAKNLFTVRAKKGSYVTSKLISGVLCGSLMLVFYFVGALIASAISGLSFSFEGFNILNLVMCMLAKIFLMPVFVSIFTVIAVSAKKKAWLSICGSLGGGMLLFMMVSMITPLNSTPVNVLLCLAASLMFCFSLGSVCKTILNKTSLV